VTALTVGVTTAKHLECKRGIATNFAAALARHSAISDRVCLVDADPFALDVTTRLAVNGPILEDFARAEIPPVARLGRTHSPEMAVIPCGGSAIGRIRFAVDRVLPEIREAFDVVVFDLPGGPGGPGSVVGTRLEFLDCLVLAVTPEPTAVGAAAHFLELFNTAKDRGDIGPVALAVVATGDESHETMSPVDMEARLGTEVTVAVPQYWGRAEPNLGFGPALAIPELDDAVYDLFTAIRRREDVPSLLTL